MAVTLNIVLNDSEQAKLLEFAAILAPGATPLEVKAWAEKQAKLGLRETIQRKLNNHNYDSLEQAWPMEQPVPPPPPAI